MRKLKHLKQFDEDSNIYLLINWMNHYINAKNASEKYELIFKCKPYLSAAFNTEEISKLNQMLVDIKKRFLFHKDEDYREDIFEEIDNYFLKLIDKLDKQN